MIKDQMDKKFGSPWHVIVGRGFAYEITYEVSKVQGSGAAAGCGCSAGVKCSPGAAAPGLQCWQ